jgi:hypothetical protein
MLEAKSQSGPLAPMGRGWLSEAKPGEGPSGHYRPDPHRGIVERHSTKRRHLV